MDKILLVVGHQRSAQGAVNHEVKQTEWEFNSVLINLIVGLMGERAVILCQDVPHWKKAPIINEMHAKTPFRAVIEFHLNFCNEAPKVNYSLAKYARGSIRGQALAIELISALRTVGMIPAKWAETTPAGVFPTDKTPPKDQQHGEWWDKNGWKYRGATFLWKTKPPAVLLESFFISCTDFLKKVNNPNEMMALAKALVAGITKYLGEIHDSVSDED